jgi:hypothetical protein
VDVGTVRERGAGDFLDVAVLIFGRTVEAQIRSPRAAPN